jgi:hypothetical protein
MPDASEIEQLSSGAGASGADDAGPAPLSPRTVDAVAERVYRLMRDDLRRLRERGGLGGWR